MTPTTSPTPVPRNSQDVPGGVVHPLPTDLREATPPLWRPGSRSHPWPATSSSAGSKTPSKRPRVSVASASPWISCRTVNADHAAGPVANTGNPAGSEDHARDHQYAEYAHNAVSDQRCQVSKPCTGPPAQDGSSEHQQKLPTQ